MIWCRPVAGLQERAAAEVDAKIADLAEENRQVGSGTVQISGAGRR
ncbi:hypothetical protein ACIBTP_28800 [Streptomyces avidinii]